MRLVLVLLAGLLALPAQAFERAELDKVQTQMLAPTVQLGDERGPFCSGFIFHSDRDEATGEVNTLVMTAAHCTERVGDPIEVIVPVYDGNRLVAAQTYMAVVAGRYSAHDLAYLRLRDHDTVMPTVILGTEDTELIEGEAMWAVGFPNGLARTVTEGTFGQIEQLRDGTKWLDFYRTTPAIFGGSSGGPQFHQTADGDFEVVGVVSRMWSMTSFMNYSVPLENVLVYLEIVRGTEHIVAEVAGSQTTE